MTKLLAFLSLCLAVHGAGTVQVTLAPLGTTNNYDLRFSWTADANADPVTATSSNVPGVDLAALQGLTILSVESAPGAPAPTNNYTLAVYDGLGVNILGAVSTGSASSSAPQSWSVLSTTPPLNGAISIAITGNSVGGAKGTVDVYLGRGGQGQLLSASRPSPTPQPGINGVTNVSVTSLASGFTASVQSPTTTPAITIATTAENPAAVYAGPCSAPAGQPSFRPLCATDIPNNAASTSGNAGTATALAGTPTLCGAGLAAQGILPNGNATSCISVGAGGGVNEPANSVNAGPSSGSAAPATFRSLVPADLPVNITSSTSGNAATASALAGTPTLCGSGTAAQGILANGNATSCVSVTGGGGGGGPTLQTNSANNYTQSSLNLESGSAFNGLSVTATNPSGGNVQLGLSGTLQNAGLANPSVTINTTAPLGGGGQVALGGTLNLTCVSCSGGGGGGGGATNSSQLTDFAVTATGSTISVNPGVYRIGYAAYPYPGTTTFTLGQLTIASIASATQAVLTFSSPINGVMHLGDTFYISGATGSGCASLNGLQSIVNVETSTVVVINWNSQSCSYTPNSATFGANPAASGTGYIYGDNQGNLTLMMPSTVGLLVNGTAPSGTPAPIVIQSSSPGYGAGSVPIAQFTLSSAGNGSWGTTTDQRAFMSTTGILAGAGLITNEAGGIWTLGIDPAVVPELGAGNTWTGANDFSAANSTLPMKLSGSAPVTCSVGQFYFNTGSGHTYACTTPNSWSQVDGGGGGGGGGGSGITWSGSVAAGCIAVYLTSSTVGCANANTTIDSSGDISTPGSGSFGVGSGTPGTDQPGTTTVSALATCNAGAKGTMAVVTDASSPTYLGTLTGGGSTLTPAVCNGTNWVAY